MSLPDREGETVLRNVAMFRHVHSQLHGLVYKRTTSFSLVIGTTMNAERRDPDDAAERVRADERHRLALYLHDSVAQVLALAKLQLTRIQTAVREPLDPSKQAWLQTTVDALIPELDAAIQAIQEEVFTLNVTALTEVDLTVALQQECATFRRRTGIPCDARFEALDLDAERGAVVVQILREALANIARHSHATTADATLQRSGDNGILSVRDNGIGIDPRRVRAPDSIGIWSMEQRARTLGGELTIDSRPHEGTRIRMSFPLAHPLENTSRPG
jgi:signal transduction histidine kinase